MNETLKFILEWLALAFWIGIIIAQLLRIKKQKRELYFWRESYRVSKNSEDFYKKQVSRYSTDAERFRVVGNDCTKKLSECGKAVKELEDQKEFYKKNYERLAKRAGEKF